MPANFFAMAEINIRINGEQKTVKSETLAQLLTEIDLADRKVAVELNKNIISRPEYPSTNLSDGDSIEIVHFVGGG